MMAHKKKSGTENSPEQLVCIRLHAGRQFPFRDGINVIGLNYWPLIPQPHPLLSKMNLGELLKIRNLFPLPKMGMVIPGTYLQAVGVKTK